MMYTVTNSESLKPGMELIMQNHNLTQKLADTERLLNAVLADQAAKDKAAQDAEEARKAAEEARKAAEVEEAIEHIERLKKRDYEHDYWLRKIYKRDRLRPGVKRVWA